MKKLLFIMDIQEATNCYEMQKDYKTNRNTLKKYLKSLGELKLQLSRFNMQLGLPFRKINEIAKSAPNKKRTELNYFLIQGSKVFEKFSKQMQKPATFYRQLMTSMIQLSQKIQKYLKQSKKTYEKNKQAHQKIIYDYCAQCFPESTTLLFKIGLVNEKKITKKQNPIRENQIIEESKLYSSSVEHQIIVMEDLKKQCIQVGNKFYMLAKDYWIDALTALKQQIQMYEVNNQAVEEFFPNAGQCSFRSGRSGNQQVQQEIQ